LVEILGNYVIPFFLKWALFYALQYYNNSMFNGVKKAVEEYSKERNIPYFPLSDGCGSVINKK